MAKSIKHRYPNQTNRFSPARLHPEHSDFAEATPERLEDVRVVFQSYGYKDIQVI